MSPKPLHRGLTLVVSAVLAAGLLAASSTVHLALAAYLRERLDAELTDTPVVFVGQTGGTSLPVTDHDDDPGTGPLATPFLQRLGTDPRTQTGRDADGRPFTAELPATLPRLSRSASGRVEAFLDVWSAGPDPIRLRARIATDADGQTLIIALPRTGIDAVLHRLALIQVGVSAGVVVVVSGTAGWLVRRRLRPLRRLAEEVERLHPDDPAAQVRVDPATREVHDLAIATNALVLRVRDLLDREQDTQRRLRQFIADASHELRTPVAAVSAYAQLYDLGAKDRPADLARSMRGILHEAARMRDLAESLISLAATDPEVPHETEPVDVATTIGQAVDAALAIDARRAVLMSVDPAAGLVAAEPVGLRQVLDNLIGNVRTHTPAGTTTRVEARRQGPEVIISVIDDGPGLGPDERDRMFDRFWRKDPSRSRQAGGSGLGLSIVAALVASWDGTVAAAESDGGGLTVSVTLPAH